MNTFEKVQEEGKLFLKVTTQDGLGNINITYRLCKDSEEFQKVQKELIANITTKLAEVNKALIELPKVSEILEFELNSIKSL